MIKLILYILYLEQLKKNVDIKIENEIYEKMIDLKKSETNSTSIHDYTFVVLEKLYLKKMINLMPFSKSYQLFRYCYF